MVKSRDHWTITRIHRDRSRHRRTGTIRLPADYVTEDLELGLELEPHLSSHLSPR